MNLFLNNTMRYLKIINVWVFAYPIIQSSVSWLGKCGAVFFLFSLIPYLRHHLNQVEINNIICNLKLEIQ